MHQQVFLDKQRVEFLFGDRISDHSHVIARLDAVLAFPHQISPSRLSACGASRNMDCRCQCVLNASQLLRCGNFLAVTENVQSPAFAIPLKVLGVVPERLSLEHACPR